MRNTLGLEPPSYSEERRDPTSRTYVASIVQPVTVTVPVLALEVVGHDDAARTPVVGSRVTMVETMSTLNNISSNLRQIAVSWSAALLRYTDLRGER
jgi:hypothetical protein